jgi:twitching motility protein PilT
MVIRGGLELLIPNKIRTIDELNLPPIFHEFTQYKQGLVLVTGPTGEGKSTTLAALIDEINANRSEHILTIEDPVEFVYQPKQSIISQREIHHDTMGWDIALKSALREDPNVVLVGEMRDFETIAAAITVAETGHLVFATLHTATAAQTIDRIIDVFPSHQQDQIRQQLASTVRAVVSQRLIPVLKGGRVAAIELMIANSAVKNLIREGKTFQIDNVIQTASAEGMMLVETSLVKLVQQGQISEQVARQYAFRYDEFDRLLHGR